MDTQPKFIDLRRAQERWGPKLGKLYQMLASGDLRGIKVGRRTYLDVEFGDRVFLSRPPFQSRRRGAAIQSARSARTEAINLHPVEGAHND